MLYHEDGALKRLGHAHIYGVAHFAQNKVETDTLLIFTLPPGNPTIHARKLHLYVDACSRMGI